MKQIDNLFLFVIIFNLVDIWYVRNVYVRVIVMYAL